MSKGRFTNYAEVEEWLEQNDIEYYKLSEHHYRVLGPVALVDLWPSRMTVNVIQTEAVYPQKFFRMSLCFNPNELNNVLNGRRWNE